MTIILEMPTELETELRHAAARAGVAPDAFIVELLEQDLGRKSIDKTSTQRLSKQEATLLQRINDSLSQLEWQRYRVLVAKRRSETLTTDEHKELIDLSDQIEEANARRIGALAELARLRKTSLESLMSDLGIKPKSYA